MNTSALLEKRRDAVRETPKIERVIKGSIVIVRRYCGKPNCKCRKGAKHRSLYVSLTDKGRQRLVYIPKRSEDEVQRLIGNYRALKASLEKISRINMSIMTAPDKRA